MRPIPTISAQLIANRQDKLFLEIGINRIELHLEQLQRLDLTHALTDELSTQLWELGTLGIIEDERAVTAFFNDETDLTEVSAKYSACQSSCDALPATTTLQLAPAEPVLAGARFVITSSSNRSPTPPGRIRLDIDASSAFGSGRHETTQLVLTALESHLRPGSLVLDVGSGSGIISAAAYALGAGMVVACDIDQLSLELTRKSAPNAFLFNGSVDAIASASVPLIIANISASVIDLLTYDLARISQPGATLILSGFIHGHGPNGFKPERIFNLNEWQCWICRPELIHLPPISKTRVVQPFARMWW